jgi:hypothetical protein
MTNQSMTVQSTEAIRRCEGHRLYSAEGGPVRSNFKGRHISGTQVAIAKAPARKAKAAKSPARKPIAKKTIAKAWSRHTRAVTLAYASIDSPRCEALATDLRAVQLAHAPLFPRSWSGSCKLKGGVPRCGINKPIRPCSGQYARESAASNFRSREWERVMLGLIVAYWVWLISALIAGSPAGYWLIARASAEEARRAAEAKAAEGARRVREAKAAEDWDGAKNEEVWLLMAGEGPATSTPASTPPPVR